MLKSSLCDYRDAYIFVKQTKSIARQGASTAAKAADKDDKQTIFKNCAPFTGRVSETSETQIDNAKDLDVVIPMHNITEYNDDYANASEVCGIIIEINQLII